MFSSIQSSRFIFSRIKKKQNSSKAAGPCQAVSGSSFQEKFNTNDDDDYDEDLLLATATSATTSDDDDAQTQTEITKCIQ